MLNREIYSVDPLQRKLENQGVANVNDDTSDSGALSVLRYELQTFVCDGQYEKGIQDILETYLKNINKPEQPGVWVSGFFGSGSVARHGRRQESDGGRRCLAARTRPD